MNNTKKYYGPKFDAHIHLRGVKDTQEMLQYLEEFNVQKFVGIVWEDQKEEVEKHFPDHFIFARFLSLQLVAQNKIQTALDFIDKAYERGYPLIKFWLSPRWIDYALERFNIRNPSRIELDDPKLEPIFSRLEDHDLTLLIHVADPNTYYHRKYQPVSRYGRKKDHLKELENVITRHPKLRVIGAHFAGQPECLTNLSRWLDNYPNFYVDTASARWMARELGHQREKSVWFFEKYQDRILFGTDIISGRRDLGEIPSYYLDRYRTYQTLFETPIDGMLLPFPDEENNNDTTINGLDLSYSVLKKIYWDNSIRLLGG